MTSEEIKRAKTLSSVVASIGKAPKPVLKRLGDYMPSSEKQMIFESPESIASKLNSLPEGSLGHHLIKEPLTAKDVIDEMRKLSGNDRLDISNIRNGENLARAAQRQIVDMNDMRWHGGGGSFGSNLQSDVFVSTLNQTVFVASKNVASTVYFTINGVLQTPTNVDPSGHYTVSGGKATISFSIPANSIIVWTYSIS